MHSDSLEAVLQFDLDIGAQLDIIKAVFMSFHGFSRADLILSTSFHCCLEVAFVSKKPSLGRPLAFTTSCTSQLYRSTRSTQQIDVRIFRAVLLASLSLLSFLIIK